MDDRVSWETAKRKDTGKKSRVILVTPDGEAYGAETRIEALVVTVENRRFVGDSGGNIRLESTNNQKMVHGSQRHVYTGEYTK